MTRAEEYRQYATECIRVSRQIENPTDKAMLLAMAEKWQMLALKEELDEQGSSN